MQFLYPLERLMLTAGRVDDSLKPRDYSQLFDLFQLRTIVGAFTTEQWKLLRKQEYKSVSHLSLDRHF